MQVNTEETIIVHPIKPPFENDHVLSLSHLDTDRNLDVILRYFRVYVNKHHRNHPHVDASAFDVIATALSRALVHYYPLAGTLRRRERDDRYELHCQKGKGVSFIRATADCSLSSVNYLDDPNGNSVENLVPDPDPDYGLTHPVILQVTTFKCGGFVLGTSVHHSLCDGLGATQFFNAMAELARGADRVTVEPVWDRVNLLGARDPPRVEFPVQEFLSLDDGFFPYSRSGTRFVRECFPVEDECLDRFKRFLHNQSGTNFTTFEALGAFIWRAKVKATGVPGDEKVKFAYSINIRKLVKPPLPSGYWGNGCVPMYVHLLAKDLLEKPIWQTAELIKRSKHNSNDEYVRSFIDFQDLHFSKGITAGKNVSGFTDWRHLGHSTLDFGWGGPVTISPLSQSLLGSAEPCFFLPYSSATEERKNGFKVLVYLNESAVPEFRKEMNSLRRPEREPHSPFTKI